MCKRMLLLVATLALPGPALAQQPHRTSAAYERLFGEQHAREVGLDALHFDVTTLGGATARGMPTYALFASVQCFSIAAFAGLSQRPAGGGVAPAVGLGVLLADIDDYALVGRMLFELPDLRVRGGLLTLGVQIPLGVGLLFRAEGGAHCTGREQGCALWAGGGLSYRFATVADYTRGL